MFRAIVSLLAQPFAQWPWLLCFAAAFFVTTKAWEPFRHVSHSFSAHQLIGPCAIEHVQVWDSDQLRRLDNVMIPVWFVQTFERARIGVSRHDAFSEEECAQLAQQLASNEPSDQRAVSAASDPRLDVGFTQRINLVMRLPNPRFGSSGWMIAAAVWALFVLRLWLSVVERLKRIGAVRRELAAFAPLPLGALGGVTLTYIALWAGLDWLAQAQLFSSLERNPIEPLLRLSNWEAATLMGVAGAVGFLAAVLVLGLGALALLGSSLVALATWLSSRGTDAAIAPMNADRVAKPETSTATQVFALMGLCLVCWGGLGLFAGLLGFGMTLGLAQVAQALVEGDQLSANMTDNESAGIFLVSRAMAVLFAAYVAVLSANAWSWVFYRRCAQGAAPS